MSAPVAIGVAAVSFVVMEPVTYLMHRYVMHGFGLAWHRSHHRVRRGPFERNDLYPVVIASSTIALMAVGTFVPALRILVPVGIGMTLYGAAYLFVHDGYIHRRLPGLEARWPVFERWARAHAVHHRFGEEPYGMLFPIVPARLQDRARTRAGAGRSEVAK